MIAALAELDDVDAPEDTDDLPEATQADVEVAIAALEDEQCDERDEETESA